MIRVFCYFRVLTYIHSSTSFLPLEKWKLHSHSLNRQICVWFNSVLVLFVLFFSSFLFALCYVMAYCNSIIADIFVRFSYFGTFFHDKSTYLNICHVFIVSTGFFFRSVFQKIKIVSKKKLSTLLRLKFFFSLL